MNTGLKITAFAAALAATFGAAYAVGSAVEPVVAESGRTGHEAEEKDGTDAHQGHAGQESGR
ncbi:hypothetical protein AB0903_27115 [Streptomyces sp. NPDC048389]|uniref:hypothetical protein n=1 Tax=Streptomyces sp. NPDC048389 TaxID=3154622 RepID=UPI0034519F49